jgi:REP element-mobilizing transposase RayT
MMRKLRFEIPGGMYHITSRGNERRAIFRDDRDRQRLLSVASAAVDEFGWLVHAYCLMPNHYHLLVETPQPNISRGMMKINGVYAQAFNNRHKRVGHVFQGRFHSIVVDKDDYLHRRSRYIVLNPVRAKLVALPEQWAWSSYRPTAGTGPRPRFLVCDQILGYFGETRGKAQRAYMDFVNGNLAQGAPWHDLLGKVILGSEDFLTRVRAKVAEGDAREIDRIQARRVRPSLKSLFPDGYVRPLSLDTARRAREAHARHGYTFTEIAGVLGIHISTLSKAIRGKLKQ